MLDHLEAGDQIEAFTRDHLDAARAIVDRQPAGAGMLPRDGDVLRRGIDRRHLGAQPLERLRQQTGAAADVQRALPGEGSEAFRIEIEVPVRLLTDVAQPHRVQAVEHGRRAARIPPVHGHRTEVCRFTRHDTFVRRRGDIGIGCYSCVGHGCLLSGAPVFPKHCESPSTWPASS